MLFEAAGILVMNALIPLSLLIWIGLLIFRRLTSHLTVSPEGKWVVVSGCDSGFGKQGALQLAQRGFNVVAGCLTTGGIQSLEEYGKNLPSIGQRLHPILLDITDDYSVHSAKDEVAKLVGDQGLWALVNNAGIMGVAVPDAWLRVSDYRHVFEINVFGHIRMVHAFLPLVLKAKGRIINTCSFVGHVAVPLAGPYVTSKHAIAGYTNMLRREMSRLRIQVIEIVPGASPTALADPRLFIEKYQERFDQLSDELQAKYDSAHVQKKTQSIERTLMGSRLNPPSNIADAYLHAVSAVFPRPTYWVGWDSKWIFRLLSCLPEEIQDLHCWISLRFVGDPDA